MCTLLMGAKMRGVIQLFSQGLRNFFCTSYDCYSADQILEI